PMKYIKWLGLLAAAVLIAACFQPWVIVKSQNLIISGVDTTGTNFGKPAYIHFIASAIYVLLTLIPTVWAKRSNLLFAAINFAWAMRNFFLVSACSAGECPERQPWIYILLVSAIIMVLGSFFPDMPRQKAKA